MEKPPVVFVHGMYMNAASWAPWVAVASDRGFEATAPSWPFHDGPPATLRAQIDPGLGALTFGAVVDHFRAVVGRMSVPPILIGHSIGGLVVQRLINEGRGRMGVAISSAPPRGLVSLDPHFFRSNLPHVNPLAGNKPVLMTPARFHYTFGNSVARAASDDLFEQYVVPESRNVPRTTLTNQGRIDFGKRHAPLLFVAGEHDHLTPSALIRRNAAAYGQSSGGLEFRTFSGRSHLICNQDGWEEVAASVFDWVEGGN